MTPNLTPASEQFINTGANSCVGAGLHNATASATIATAHESRVRKHDRR
jgi:hypothetical protein